MSDQLKNFVRKHRAEFDTHTAPLFVATTVAAPVGAVQLFGLKISKIIVGAVISVSAVVGGVYVVKQSSPKSNPSRAAKSLRPSVKSDGTERVLLSDTNEKTQNHVEKAVSTATPKQKNRGIASPEDMPVQSPDNKDTLFAEHAIAFSAFEGFASDLDTLFSDVSKLKVNVSFCNIVLTQSEDDKLHLQAHLSESCGSTLVLGKKRYTKSQTLLHYSYSKGELKVWTETSSLSVRKEIDNNDASSILTIQVPVGKYVHIENGSGSISVNSLSADSLKLQTQFGSMQLHAVTAKTKLLASSGSIKASDLSGPCFASVEFGSIKLQHLVGESTVQCSSGNIAIADVQGNLEVRSTFGSQKISDVKGNIRTVSASGSIKLLGVIGNIESTGSFGSQNFEKITGNISAEASSGNILLASVDGSLSLHTSFGSITGYGVRLAGPSEFKASSGNIRIKLSNAMSELGFDLSSSSGSIKIIEAENQITSSKQQLKLGSGKFLISGGTTFGNQTYDLSAKN